MIKSAYFKFIFLLFYTDSQHREELFTMNLRLARNVVNLNLPLILRTLQLKNLEQKVKDINLRARGPHCTQKRATLQLYHLHNYNHATSLHKQCQRLYSWSSWPCTLWRSLLRILNVITQARKSWKQICDTPQSNNAEKGKMKNGLIALINGSFFYVYVCYVRGNGSQPPRTGTDTWDEDCGYRPYTTTQRIEHKTLQDV